MPPVRKRAKKARRKPYSERTLLKFIKNHLSKNFPNPRRKGCPRRETLERLAKEPQKVNSSVVHHVFRCSPCYKTCSRLLARMKVQ